MNGKTKLAFVDLSFHEITRSADFLRNIFKEKYEIINFWDEEWLGKKPTCKKVLKNFDTIFYFQSINSYSDLNYLKKKNITWAPMYDNLRLDNFFWKQIKFSNIKVIAFSKKIKNLCEQHKIPHIYVKYYIETSQNQKTINEKKINIFFWYRGYIEIKDWINFFKPNQVTIDCLEILDPKKKEQQIPKKILEQFDIKITKKEFLKKEDYLNYVKNCDVFVCPRKAEGIGMSMVEAISEGKYLIAFDNNTMNEYIENDKIGFLFNNYTNYKVNINNIFKYSNYRTIESYKNYLKWKKSEEEILDFLINKNVKLIHKITWYQHLVFIINDIYILVKRNIKNFIKKILFKNND